MHRPQAMYDALQLDEEFLAGNTKRAVGLVAKSATVREQVIHPSTLAAFEAILAMAHEDYRAGQHTSFTIERRNQVSRDLPALVAAI